MSFGKLKDEPERLTPFTNAGGRPGVISGGNVDAFLGKGSRVVGTLSFSGPVELDGDVEGEIQAKERLVIGESAMIKAKVTGGEILVKGTITGDITATKTLTLKRPAKILGNINAANLSIEEGVIFEGKCTMGAASSIKGEHKPAEKAGAVA